MYSQSDIKLSDKGIESLEYISYLKEDCVNLCLSNRNLANSDFHIIYPYITPFINLKSLDLSTNKLSEETSKLIYNLLVNLNNLEILNLSDNHLADNGICIISNAIPKNLTQINLYKNRIGNKGIGALSEILPILSNLKVLNLSYNRIKDEGCILLARSFKNMGSIECINLNLNLISDSGGMFIFDSIALLKLSSFSIASNYLTISSLKSLVGLCNSNSAMSLIKLDISNNCKQDLGGIVIFQILGKLGSLQVLNLNKIIFNNEDIFAFSKNITSMTYLRVLSLSGINSNDDFEIQFEKLFTSFASLKNLNELYLSNNKVTSNSTKILFNSINYLESLNILDLSKNKINSLGAEQASHLFSQATLDNKSLSLKVLNLSDNYIDDAGCIKLLDSLIFYNSIFTWNKKFYAIDLSYNFIYFEIDRLYIINNSSFKVIFRSLESRKERKKELVGKVFKKFLLENDE